MGWPRDTRPQLARTRSRVDAEDALFSAGNAYIVAASQNKFAGAVGL